MNDKTQINVSAEEIARLVNKDALRLIDRFRCDVDILLTDLEKMNIGIAERCSYIYLVKLLADCDAYDKKLEDMGIYINKP